jgi:hypothetical protein
MKKVGDYFDIQYGKFSTPINQLEEGTTPLISSGSINNGVTGFFNLEPIYKNVISVARTGSVGESFFHDYKCVINSDCMVLNPKFELSVNQIFWFVLFLRNQRKLFSYARKVTPTRLANILVPEIPNWIEQASVPIYDLEIEIDLNNKFENSNLVKVEDLFEVQYGTNLALNALEETEIKEENCVNFVSRTTKNNGISAFVRVLENLKPLPAGLLTVAVGGSVLETFVQDEPFYTGRDMYYLVPKREMILSEKLFYAFCIRANKYRYNYNRQANRTLRELKIPAHLPAWFVSESIEKQLS